MHGIMYLETYVHAYLCICIYYLSLAGAYCQYLGWNLPLSVHYNYKYLGNPELSLEFRTWIKVCT